MLKKILWLLALIFLCFIIPIMATDTWGMLPKSQIDPQLIEERIAEMIAEHESDPEAHLGVGESLESHRSNEVIDHPEQSLVPDKIAATWARFPIDFGSVDGFLTEGYATSEFPSARLYVVSGEEALSRLFSFMDLLSGRGILTSSFVLDFSARATENNSSFRWSVGFYTGQAGVGSFNTGEGVYFEYSSGTLKAIAKSGSETLSATITGIDISQVHSYRIFYDTVDEQIYFIVDGDQKAALDVPLSFDATPIYFTAQNQGQGGSYDVSLYVGPLTFSYEL